MIVLKNTSRACGCLQRNLGRGGSKNKQDCTSRIKTRLGFQQNTEQAECTRTLQFGGTTPLEY